MRISKARLHLTAFPLGRPCVVSKHSELLDSRFSVENLKEAAYAA